MTAEKTPNVRVIVRVEGQVQGVGYRVSARRKADELGIDAEPANLDDGAVRIAVSGADAAVQRFIEWCRSGPPDAVVTSVTVSDNR